MGNYEYLYNSRDFVKNFKNKIFWKYYLSPLPPIAPLSQKKKIKKITFRFYKYIIFLKKVFYHSNPLPTPSPY